MKILENGQMPDGTDIQREDWHENYDFMAYGATVATYPIAKESIDRPFAPKRGKRFRCEFDFTTTEQAKQCFEQLKDGEKTLKDFREYLDRPDYEICL